MLFDGNNGIEQNGVDLEKLIQFLPSNISELAQYNATLPIENAHAINIENLKIQYAKAFRLKRIG